MTRLLLLVDLQRDYLALPGLEPAPGAVVARARTLLDGFRAQGLPVIHVWTTVSRAHDQRMRHWKREGVWRCEQGTPGHLPAPGLEPGDEEAVVHKHGFDPFAGGGFTGCWTSIASARWCSPGCTCTRACARPRSVRTPESR